MQRRFCYLNFERKWKKRCLNWMLLICSFCHNSQKGQILPKLERVEHWRSLQLFELSNVINFDDLLWLIGSSFSIPAGLSKLSLLHQRVKFSINHFVLYDVNKWNTYRYSVWIHSIPSNDIRVASTRMGCLDISVVTITSIFKTMHWYLFLFQKEWVVLKRISLLE
jgi:hypothetical protein